MILVRVSFQDQVLLTLNSSPMFRPGPKPVKLVRLIAGNDCTGNCVTRLCEMPSEARSNG